MASQPGGYDEADHLLAPHECEVRGGHRRVPPRRTAPAGCRVTSKSISSPLSQALTPGSPPWREVTLETEAMRTTSHLEQHNSRIGECPRNCAAFQEVVISLSLQHGIVLL